MPLGYGGGTLGEYIFDVVEHSSINVTEAARPRTSAVRRQKRVLAGLAERNILDHVHSRTIERDSTAYFILKKRFVGRLRAQEAAEMSEKPKP